MIPTQTHPKRTILLMDDEIASAPLLKDAIQALRDAGFSVETTDRMSAAMDAFYQRYFHIFILDIDMSVVTDTREGDGGDVARFLRALDSQTHVIFFSARGQAKHWFDAANYHLFGYVFKNGAGLQELVAMAERAAALDTKPPAFPRRETPPECALLYVDPQNHDYNLEKARALLQASLPPTWIIDTFTDPQTASHALEGKSPLYGLAVAFVERLPPKPSKLKPLQMLCEQQHRPHVLFATQGHESHRDAILEIVNAHPFRMIDLLEKDHPERLQQAIADALRLYGNAEQLLAPTEDLQRLKIAFSPESLLSIKPDYPEDDDLWLSDEETPEENTEDWASKESKLPSSPASSDTTDASAQTQENTNPKGGAQ